MTKSILEQVKEAREKVEAQPAVTQPAVVTRPYDPEMADAILEAALELHGGEGAWSVNFKALENGGLNSKGEPGVLGAIKTQKFSPEHPKAVVLYNGNRGPNGVFSGFDAEGVEAIIHDATEAYVDAVTAEMS